MKQNRRVYIFIGAMTVLLAVCLIAVLLKDKDKPAKPDGKENAVTGTPTPGDDTENPDSIVYRVRLENDAYTEYGYTKLGFRTETEYAKSLNCTLDVTADKPPYIWNGGYSDLRFPMVPSYDLPKRESIEISCFTDVGIVYDKAANCSLNITCGEETLWTVYEVDELRCLDLTGDGCPEVLVCCLDDSGYNSVIRVYDIQNRAEYMFDEVPQGSYVSWKVMSDSAVMRVYGPDNSGSGSWKEVETLGTFAVKDGQLVFEKCEEADLFPEISEIPATGTPLCWFDHANGDLPMKRAIRLPEYPDIIFLADERGLHAYSESEKRSYELEYRAVTAVYLADLDGNGERELYTVATATHADRELKRIAPNPPGTFAEPEAILGGYQFTVDWLYDELRYNNTAEDDVFWSNARFVVRNNSLIVAMDAPDLAEKTEITLQIVDIGEYYDFPTKSQVYYTRTMYLTDDDSRYAYQLLRVEDTGRAFIADDDSLLILSEYPNRVIIPGRSEIIDTDSSTLISYYFPELGSGVGAVMFADLDGDGKREMFVDNGMIDVESGALKSSLAGEYSLVWFRDEIRVKTGKRDYAHNDYEVDIRTKIVGRPVLLNGKLGIAIED